MNAEDSKGTRRGRVLLKLGDWFISPLLVAVLLFAFGPTIAERVEISRPTCEDPRGTVPLPVASSWVQVSSFEKPPPPLISRGWDGSHVVDGKGTSYWVPGDIDKNPWVSFEFPKKQNLRLICIVNGAAANGIFYLRADRVRTASVATDAVADGDAPISLVRNQSTEYEIQNEQPLEFVVGSTKSVTINILSTYGGQKVYEPRGDVLVPLEPTGHTALAEVVFYVDRE